jgi:telomere length regulation protein
LLADLAKNETSGMATLKDLASQLRPYEAKVLFSTIVRLLDRRVTTITETAKSNTKLVGLLISDISGFLKSLTSSNELFADELVDMMSKPESSGARMSPLLLEAGIAALSSDKIRMATLLEASFRKFCDELSINHSPVLQQEFNAMLLLLLSGCMARHGASRIRSLFRSTEFMKSITKHLASNSNRVKWLGMIVATGLSSLVDEDNKALKFEDDSLKNVEAKKYLGLLKMDITPSKTFQLRDIFGETEVIAVAQKTASSQAITKSKAVTKKKASKIKPIDEASRIIEIFDDDEDLVPYTKPDTDDEDSEEDPTLVDRDKPNPPV